MDLAGNGAGGARAGWRVSSVVPGTVPGRSGGDVEDQLLATSRGRDLAHRRRARCHARARLVARGRGTRRGRRATSIGWSISNRGARCSTWCRSGKTSRMRSVGGSMAQPRRRSAR